MQTEVFKFKVVKSDNIEFPFNVQIWKSIDKETFFYTGNGKFFKTHQEASRYAQKQLLETINK